ncbi:L-aspartate oxidase [bacterium]|nr:L-aspartate oxidase [bacterium]
MLRRLAAEQGDVRVVTKKESFESNTNYAQGGIAAVLSPLDDFELHVQDTLIAGDGLCDEAVVRDMVNAAPRLIDRLLAYGVNFTRAKDSDAYALGREGGHSRNRIVHADDLTGRELEKCLLAACRDHPRIRLDENHVGLDLIKGDGLAGTELPPGRVAGCWVLDSQTLTTTPYLADVVVLATGGCGKVYAYTSNPDIATGDGMAMAYRAGALLANLEFVQFHPTCLYHPDAKSFLISEAVRGEGAHLINGRGERFMPRYDPRLELAPRDVVARSIDRELKLTGDPCVYLDLRHLDRDFVYERFPHLTETCRRFGIDMAADPVPVVPAAHYMCGGVRIDADGRSNLTGLLAIGEVACSGVHGANRLASNSLLEAVYFAENASRAAIDIDADVTGAAGSGHLQVAGHLGADLSPEAMILEHDWDVVRRVMWDYVGIVRSHNRLDIALERIRNIRATVEIAYKAAVPSPDLVELRNIALNAELIVLCAQARRESRGLHYTLDHPAKTDVPADTLIGAGTDLRAMTFDGTAS